MTDDDVRFEFGENWREFLKVLSEDQIETAVEAMREITGRDSLAGVRFLDLGSGSGLHSLAAHRLGAEVVSIDYDQECVACTNHLRETYGTQGPSWSVHRGSALDPGLRGTYGTFDIVYSWGVLHHTGGMWTAIDLTSRLPASGGSFVLSIYNDEGWSSRKWWHFKRIYCKSPGWIQWLMTWLVVLRFEIPNWYNYLRYCCLRIIRLKGIGPCREVLRYPGERGMDRWRDAVDWAGGFPFEVASPDEVFNFLKARGFRLEFLRTRGRGHGCHEFRFVRGSDGNMTTEGDGQ